MIKLLTLDMDGTLVGEDGAIKEPLKRSLHRALENGIDILFVSGRSINGVLAQKKALGLMHIDSFADNGATFFADGARVRITKTIPDEHSSFLIGEMLKLGAETFAFAAGKLYYEHLSPFMDPLVRRFNADIPQVQVNDLTKIKGIYKICMYFKTTADFPKATTLAGEHCEFSQGYELFGDYTPKGIDKGYALYSYMQDHGLSPEEVLAVGDSDNDIPLLCAAGYACAVANANETTKAHADMILPSCEEMGVKYLIDHYILGSKTL